MSSAEYEIRPYHSSDAQRTLAIFQEAVRSTASKDYTPEQIAAWLGNGPRDLAAWDQAMSARRSFVACSNGEVMGFTDVNSAGYIDMMYVAPEHGHQGVGTVLLKHVEDIMRQTGVRALNAQVSITARLFFERHGFSVVSERQVSIRGVELTNYTMIKYLG